MAFATPTLLWTIVLPVSALSLAFGAFPLMVTTYTTAYYAAPREITTFVDAVECSIEENESYDCDVAKVQRLEDKVRLARLLREIQTQGDDLREELNRLVVEEGGTTLRPSARFFWASHRAQLEERVRRLDMLRMRFLVVYMGVVASMTNDRATKEAAVVAAKEAKEKERLKAIPQAPPPPPPAPRPTVTKSRTTDSTPRRPPRRLTTQAIGYSEKTEHTQRTGWFGVVEELQRSPLLRQRHASIEAAMRSPPPSPIMSELSLNTSSIPEKLEI
ncbi:hypothetical protein F4808DRAFT_7378 [Astrocystis sublimbata]|nr:hypothetical protein F4808DRAFT_7378 [Astrocystis sublimbata]